MDPVAFRIGDRNVFLFDFGNAAFFQFLDEQFKLIVVVFGERDLSGEVALSGDIVQIAQHFAVFDLEFNTESIFLDRIIIDPFKVNNGVFVMIIRGGIGGNLFAFVVVKENFSRSGKKCKKLPFL